MDQKFIDMKAWSHIVFFLGIVVDFFSIGFTEVTRRCYNMFNKPQISIFICTIDLMSGFWMLQILVLCKSIVCLLYHIGYSQPLTEINDITHTHWYGSPDSQ